jgi:hypothetical protein
MELRITLECLQKPVFVARGLSTTAEAAGNFVLTIQCAA